MLLSASEIIKKSWHDYTEHWHDWVTFSLLIFVPSFLVVFFGSIILYIDSLFPSASVATSIVALVFIIIGALAYFWSSLAIINAVGHFVRSGQLSTWKENYLNTTKYLWPSFYTSFFAGFLIVIGTILFLVPGVIFSIWFYFIIYFVILEGKYGSAALGASKTLVKGRWWATWWRILAPSMVFGLGVGILQSILTTLLSAFPLDAVSLQLMKNIVSAITGSLSIPLTVIAVVNLFFSLQANPLVSVPTEPPATV